MVLNTIWKYKRGILIIAGLLILIYIIVKIVDGFSDLAQASKEDLPVEFSITPEDSSCFSKEAWSKLNVLETHRSKVRYPVSVLSYGNEYDLVMFRIAYENTEKSLKNIFVTESEDADRSVGVVYTILETGSFSIQFKSGSIKPVSKLFLTLTTESFSTSMKNDSTLICHLICKKMSIKFREKGPVDVFFEATTGINDPKMPIELAVLKRQNTILLLLVADKTPKTNSMPKLIENIVLF